MCRFLAPADYYRLWLDLRDTYIHVHNSLCTMKNFHLVFLLLIFSFSCKHSATQGIQNNGNTALVVEAIGKEYEPEAGKVAAYQGKSDMGGSTSVRNVDRETLEWKKQGYFQRNRDLGQVFTPEKDFELEAIILRTGPSDKAVLAGTPGAEVFVQFFEVTGQPAINDNGTPAGTEAKHGFSSNHRCDDVVDSVNYQPLTIVNSGIFPDIPASFDGDTAVNGDEGRLYYMRWRFTGQPLVFKAGKKYAFLAGLVEANKDAGFTLANHNVAGVNAPPSLSDEFDAYSGGWGLRREGDGTIPPTMAPGDSPPADPVHLEQLQKESLFGTGDDRYSLLPTTDGYPDVDTYRDLTFALEVKWKHGDK